MDTEKPLDVKSLRERFQSGSRSCTLPAYTKEREEIISNVRDNPALQGVISTLENKPKVLPKPNGPARQNSIDMKLGKVFSQKFQVTDAPKTQNDGVCSKSPQTYRHSMPMFPGTPPKNNQPQSQVYEDVGPLLQQSPSINDVKIVGSKKPPLPGPKPPLPGPKPAMMTSSPVPDVAMDKMEEKVNEGPPIKPLPSITSQGPPPPKPSRPPNVDLSTFFKSQANAESNGPEEPDGTEYDLPPPSPNPPDEVYDEAFTPNDSTDDNVYEVEDAAVEYDPPDAMSPALDASSPNRTDEMSCYQDVVNLQESHYSSSVYDTNPVSSSETPEECTYEVSTDNNDDSENSYSSTMSPYPNDNSAASEGYYSVDFNASSESIGPKDNKAKEVKLGKNEQEFRKKYKISGQEQMLYSSKIIADFKPEKNSLPVKKGDTVEVVRITDCPAGKWLVRDAQRNYGFVPVNSLQVSIDIQSFSTQNIFNAPVEQDLYADVDIRPKNSGGKSDSLRRTDGYPEYDDISNVNPALNSSGGKGKGFGNFFKKDKSKKEDIGSAPVTSNQDGFVSYVDQDLYTDIDIGRRNSEDKSDSLRRTDDYPEKSDDQYDDISNVSSALNSSGGKGKGFGNFFKKDKSKKEDTGSAPVTSNQNGFVAYVDQDLYTDIDIERRNSEDKSDSLRRTDDYHEKADDQYDDISSVSSALNSPGGKGKGFGNFFKKDKSKKDDTGSAPVFPNLNRTTSQEGEEEYDTCVLGDDHEREKEEKSPGWSMFHKKNQKGSDKKFFAPKSEVKKFAKEEKIFREKFKYTGEIKILNIATINELAPLSPQNKLELPVKPGDTVEVVEVTNEDKIICRNFAGKYGYVQIEWLNFNNEIPT
ncbi:FYN-binding protein 2 isoform X2 [Hyla sarda]|uniref:FYN-binding protein 2 isoform X2 n=1 Tax=Hyla sarda TaxID=327740 RepID=UPI0024C36CFF|nr:FYN-binding protein 2 isoform X2 [Hyla sarda]